MKRIDDEELKYLQLEILKNVDTFCKNNNIEYSLAYGTLLGAIRHGGYIPWDDDIDIFMTRPNYDKFIQSYNGYSNYLYVISPEIDINYYAPYANVCDKRTILIEEGNTHTTEIGVKIDIFPIDAVPEDLYEYEQMKGKIRGLKKNLWVKRTHFSQCHTLRSKLSWIYRRLLTINRSFSSIQEEIKSIATSISFNDAVYCDNVVWDNVNARCEKKIYSCVTHVEFENNVFMSIREFDVYLRNKYGDYMKLPPESQRCMHHNFKAYWKG